MGRVGVKPRRINIPPWSPDLAYACGLMASDGCLLSDGRHMDLTSKDIEQLETFKRCIGITANITSKLNGNQQRVTRVQFGDVRLYQWFISIGITPRKTFTLGDVDIPDKYFADFLRGEFDGDGCSTAYWDTRWKSSVCLYVSFASGRTGYLKWLNTTISRLFDIRGIIGKASRTCTLTFSKTKARILCDAMYYQCGVSCLKRKKEKLDRQWQADTLSKKGVVPKNFRRGRSVLWVT